MSYNLVGMHLKIFHYGVYVFWKTKFGSLRMIQINIVMWGTRPLETVIDCNSTVCYYSTCIYIFHSIRAVPSMKNISSQNTRPSVLTELGGPDYISKKIRLLILLVSSWNINTFTLIKENPVWKRIFVMQDSKLYFFSSHCFILCRFSVREETINGQFDMYNWSTWPWNMSQVFLTLCQEVCCSVQIYFAVMSPLTITLLGPINKLNE